MTPQEVLEVLDYRPSEPLRSCVMWLWFPDRLHLLGPCGDVSVGSGRDDAELPPWGMGPLAVADDRYAIAWESEEVALDLRREAKDAVAFGVLIVSSVGEALVAPRCELSGFSTCLFARPTEPSRVVLRLWSSLQAVLW